MSEPLTGLDRVERLEYVLGTLIAWLHGGTLNTNEVSYLMQRLTLPMGTPINCNAAMQPTKGSGEVE